MPNLTTQLYSSILESTIYNTTNNDEIVTEEDGVSLLGQDSETLVVILIIVCLVLLVLLGSCLALVLYLLIKFIKMKQNEKKTSETKSTVESKTKSQTPNINRYREQSGRSSGRLSERLSIEAQMAKHMGDASKSMNNISDNDNDNESGSMKIKYDTSVSSTMTKYDHENKNRDSIDYVASVISNNSINNSQRDRGSTYHYSYRSSASGQCEPKLTPRSSRRENDQLPLQNSQSMLAIILATPPPIRAPKKELKHKHMIKTYKKRDPEIIAKTLLKDQDQDERQGQGQHQDHDHDQEQKIENLEKLEKSEKSGNLNNSNVKSNINSNNNSNSKQATLHSKSVRFSNAIGSEKEKAKVHVKKNNSDIFMNNLPLKMSPRLFNNPQSLTLEIIKNKDNDEEKDEENNSNNNNKLNNSQHRAYHTVGTNVLASGHDQIRDDWDINVPIKDSSIYYNFDASIEDDLKNDDFPMKRVTSMQTDTTTNTHDHSASASELFGINNNVRNTNNYHSNKNRNTNNNKSDNKTENDNISDNMNDNEDDRDEQGEPTKTTSNNSNVIRYASVEDSFDVNAGINVGIHSYRQESQDRKISRARFASEGLVRTRARSDRNHGGGGVVARGNAAQAIANEKAAKSFHDVNHNGAVGMTAKTKKGTAKTIRTPKPPIAVVQNGADEKQLQGQEEIMHMDENGVDAEINHDQNENQPKNGNDHADSVLLWC